MVEYFEFNLASVDIGEIDHFVVSGDKEQVLLIVPQLDQTESDVGLLS